MFDKEKLEDAKKQIADMYRKRPVEMLLATSVAIGAVGKVIHTVIEVQNAATWRREVKRRERNQRR